MEMVEARVILEFTMENLEQLRDRKFISLCKYRRQIRSLKYMRTFIQKMQESRNQRPAVSGLVADIVDKVGQLLHSTDSFLYSTNTVIRLRTFSFAKIARRLRSSTPQSYEILTRFRSCSHDLSHLVEEINSNESFKEFSLVSDVHDIVEAHNIVESALKDFQFFFLEPAKVMPFIQLDKLSSISADLHFLRYFLNGLLQSSEHQQITLPYYLLQRIKKEVNRVLLIKEDYIRIRDSALSFPKIHDLVLKIKSVEEEVFDALTGEDSYEGTSASIDRLSTRNSANSAAEEEEVIGMEDETRKLLDRMIGGWKQLEVIPVTGMAGIGKTTLARKLYNDPSIAHRFHIRAWTSVSQTYQERKCLRDILSSITGDKDPALNMSNEDIGEKLYKCLRGNKYLIVLDDVWDVQVWNRLQIYLPEDNNSSRVFITSRNKDVVPKIVHGSDVHSLRFLTEDESWDLFKHKVFGGNNFSEELMKVGKEIVATCKGLPIAIAVIGGLLAKEEKTKENWTRLAKNIRSSANSDLEYLMDIMALSYKQLSFPLKSCFPYLGSFPEDYEFSVKCLIRSWIAEGFIQRTP